MKSLFKLLVFLTLLSLSLSVRLRADSDRRHKVKRLAEDETCDEAQKTSKCDKGLDCLQLASFFGQTEKIKLDWKCKPEKYKVPVGQPCIYQFFGSQCLRDKTSYATCEGLKTYREWNGHKTKIGVCKTKGENKQLPAPALQKAQSIKTTPALDLPETVRLDEDEIEYVSDAFDMIAQGIEGKDAFTAGYIILQYFVDEDEIKNEDVKTRILRPYLEHMRKQGRKCEDIEAELDLKGIHVVNTWTTQDRNQYLWMVNNNYIKGLQGAYDKASTIRGVADATGNSLSRVIGEFASNAEVAGGFIKTLVDLAVKTVVDKQLTNALLAASSNSPSKGDGTSDKKAVYLFRKNGDSIDLGEGFGMISRNSICKELKVDAGLKYMTGVRQA